MRAVLLFFLSLLAGCRPSQSGLREKLEAELRLTHIDEVESLAFKYAKKHSSNHLFFVYSLSESDFVALKKHLVDFVGFKKFETSNNGFDVHAAFPEEEAWNQKAEYSEKKLEPSKRCSLFYFPESSIFVIEYFNSG